MKITISTNQGIFIFISYYTTPMSYQPYKYPPDYQLAYLHQQSSKPGKIPYLQSLIIKRGMNEIHDDQTNNEVKKCPCCDQIIVYPYPKKAWYQRSINEDFKDFGGAIVTYFWLLRFYAFIFGLVFIVYSAYLLVCIYQYCDTTNCEKLFAFWVVSNQNLFKLMQDKNQHDSIIRLSILRGIAYVILVVGNTVSLYLVSRFKKRYPPKKGIQNFALIFKNVNNLAQINEQLTNSLISVDQSFNPVQLVKNKILEQFPECKIIEAFTICQLEPYHTLFNEKLKIYYQLLILKPSQIQGNPKLIKKRKKLLSKLTRMQEQSQESKKNYNTISDRVIVMVDSEITRNNILSKLQLKGLKKLKYLLGFAGNTNKDTMYVEKCPLPEEINWNYIGHQQGQKIKMKIASVLCFVGLVGICYGILSFCFKIIYVYNIPTPLNGILTFLSLFLLIIMALTFRQLMNKLSEMRYPNTQTSRTMFIVITTVLFHYIFYLLLPTFYFWQAKSQEKNKNLLIVVNQTTSFIITQVVLSGLNIMYFFWKKRQPRVQNQQKPIGCQKILHKQIEYPHFPIQFKLIALFKIFSFITFFAFQAPMIVFLTFFLLVFLYYRDKKSIYFNYKKQIIDSTVQFQFLKFYAGFFVLYSFLIFIITQNLEVEFWIGFFVAVGCIIAIFLIKQPKILQDQCDIITDITKLKLSDSYQKRYQKFIETSIDTGLQSTISAYLQNPVESANNEQSNQIIQKLI